MASKLSVYYDGLCHLCSFEINHYRSMVGADNITFVDITGVDFDAEKENLDPHAVHKVMHIRDENGHVKVGVDAFIAIWENLPKMRPLVPIAKWAPLNIVLRGAYSLFAKVRPLLPRKSCETSPYCEVHSKK